MPRCCNTFVYVRFGCDSVLSLRGYLPSIPGPSNPDSFVPTCSRAFTPLSRRQNTQEFRKPFSRLLHNMCSTRLSAKQDVVTFVRERFQQTGTPPSIRQVSSGVDLSLRQLYGAFPGGLSEICKAADIPVPQDRVQSMATVQKSRENKRTLSNPTIDGGLAADVFAKFEKKVPLAKIVIDLKLGPDVVRQLYKKWVGLKRIDMNEPIVMRQIEELQGRMNWARDFILARPKSVRGQLRDDFRCPSCGVHHQGALMVVCTACNQQLRWPL
jgi:sulfur relay (sulfurtransferase) DsrC/TusE family protein